MSSEVWRSVHGGAAIVRDMTSTVTWCGVGIRALPVLAGSMPRAQRAAPILREIGRRVRAARLAAGLTQEAAAAAAGIDYKRWQRMESGSVNLTVRTLVRVAAALDVTFWQMVK